MDPALVHVLVLDDISQLLLMEEIVQTANCKPHTNKINRITLVTKILFWVFFVVVFEWVSICSVHWCFFFFLLPFNLPTECRKQIKKHYRNRPGSV